MWALLNLTLTLQLMLTLTKEIHKHLHMRLCEIAHVQWRICELFGTANLILDQQKTNTSHGPEETNFIDQD